MHCYLDHQQKLLAAAVAVLLMFFPVGTSKADLVLRVGKLSGGLVGPVVAQASDKAISIDVGVFGSVTGRDITISSFDIPLSISPSAAGIELTGAMNSALPDQGNFATSDSLSHLGVELSVFDDVEFDDAIILAAGSTTKLFEVSLLISPFSSGTYDIKFPLANSAVDVLDIRDQSNAPIEVEASSRLAGVIEVVAVPETSGFLMLLVPAVAFITYRQSNLRSSAVCI